MKGVLHVLCIVVFSLSFFLRPRMFGVFVICFCLPWLAKKGAVYMKLA